MIEINPYLLGTMAGGAADCQFWLRNLGQQCRLHELAHKKRITLSAASKLLANTLYSYRGRNLSVGTMVAGWDPDGPGLYYCDSDGSRVKGQRFSVGSGSTYAYGVLDRGYDYNMDADTAIKLAQRAIFQATFRDGAYAQHAPAAGTWHKRELMGPLCAAHHHSRSDAREFAHSFASTPPCRP